VPACRCLTRCRRSSRTSFVNDCVGTGRSCSPSRFATGTASFNTESLSPSCHALAPTLKQTLASPFGSARGWSPGLGRLRWRYASHSVAACSTPPSRGPRRGPRAGWKARATSLFPRLPLSPQDSISIPSIFRIGDLTFANSVQHAAVRFPHYQCPQQFSRCLRALVIERLRWTRGRSSLLDFDWCDGECKAQAQACRSHEPPPRFGVRPAGREQHVCRRERWVPESVCIRLATLTT